MEKYSIEKDIAQYIKKEVGPWTLPEPPLRQTWQNPGRSLGHPEPDSS